MSGLSELGELPGFAGGGAQVQQRDIDQYEIYTVLYPSVSATGIGTMAGGTNGQTKALVLINQYSDYPRNLMYSLVGTNDCGGTFTINGLDQFGSPVTESAGFGTVAAGTPAGSVYGTQVFAKVLSGSFTFAVGSAGSGSARVGFGTIGTSTYFGLPSRIGGSTDVKTITWINNGAVTAVNGGTIGAYVNVAQHAFRGTSGVAITDIYNVTFKPTFDNAGKGTMANLS